MAQAVVTDLGATELDADPSVSLTFPALTAGHTQTVSFALYGGIGITPPNANWTIDLQSDADSHFVQLTRFTRTAAHAGETATWTFSGNASGIVHKRSVSGITNTAGTARNAGTQSTYQEFFTPPQVVSLAEGVTVVEYSSSEWPNIFTPPGAMTSIYNDFVYAGAGGVAYGVARQNTGAVTTTLGQWDMQDPPNGEFVRVFTTMYAPGASLGGDYVISGSLAAQFVYAPDSPFADNIGSSSAQARWTDSSLDETSFEVEYGTSGGTYTPAGAVLANVTTYNLTGLAPATDYIFRVRAVRSGEPSAWKESPWFTTLAGTGTIDPPSNMAAFDNGNGTFTLTWQVNDIDAAFTVIDFGPAGSMSNLDTVLPATTSKTVTVSAGVDYEARVRNINSDGSVSSGYSNTVTFRRSASAPAPTPAPGTPGAAEDCCRVTMNRNLRRDC